MGYYLTIKNETLPFVVTWMDLETIILSEVSQMEEKTNTIFLSYVDSKKRKTKQIQTHRYTENRLVATRVEAGWVWRKMGKKESALRYWLATRLVTVITL